MAVREIPNNIREIEVNEELHMLNGDRLQTEGTFEEYLLGNLDVTILREEGENQYLSAQQRVLVGTLAERYGTTSRQTGMMPKFRQRINYINSLVATAYELILMPNMCRPEEVIDTTVFLALPPIECKGNEKIFQENLKGTYTVRFNRINREVKFRISDVKCNAECLLSLMYFFFDTNGSLREETQKYRSGNVLGIDIGASTTDLSVMVGGKYLEKSGSTIQIGGNQIRDYVMNEIQLQFGYMPSTEEADYVIRTGYLKSGAKEIDFSNVLFQAKREFSVQLIDRLNGYFKQIGMSPASFMCFVVGGGGSLPSYIGTGATQQATTPAMSEIITDEMKRQCPNVDIMQVPGNPRHANIGGLSVYATIWEKLENRKQAQAPVYGGQVYNGQTYNGQPYGGQAFSNQ